MTDKEKTLLNMDRLSVMLRGKVIHLYSQIEVLIDDLIKKMTFQSESDFDFYTRLLGVRNFNSETKYKVLKHCLENYDKKYGADTKFIRDQLKSITSTRNILAHCVLDNSEEGIYLYIRERKLRLIGGKDGRLKNETFSIKSINDLEKKMYDMGKELIKIQNSLLSSKSS